MEDDTAAYPVDFEAEEFYAFIRKHLVCALFFLFSYAISYAIIRYTKTRSDNDELYAGDEDYFVYRVSCVHNFGQTNSVPSCSVWLCSGSLSISIGAVTLLPFSVLGAEVLQRYPDNYYLKWLNFSLINALWNYVFLLSNASLFVALPFSYFFIESQGFAAFQLHSHEPAFTSPVPGRRPLLARFYETVVVCGLVIVLLIGIADVFYSHLFAQPSYIWLSMLCFSSLSTALLYSFASLLGVSILLLSVPLGFAKMFDVFAQMLIRQQRDKEKSLSPQPPNGFSVPSRDNLLPFHIVSQTTPERLQALTCLRQQNKLYRFQLVSLSAMTTALRHRKDVHQQTVSATNGVETAHFSPTCANGTAPQKTARSRTASPAVAYGSRQQLNGGRARLQRAWECVGAVINFLKCPLIMLALLVLTVLSVSMVLVNTLQLLFGFRALPEYVQYVEQYRHTQGIFGAIVEITIILYIMVSALVGVYSMPLIRRIRPRRAHTSMTAIIVNCIIVLFLSSALPVLVRTLGITSFDLLGNFGRINWISNFSLVWGYNVLFAGASIFCLVNKFTEPVRKELLRRFLAVTDRCWQLLGSTTSQADEDAENTAPDSAQSILVAGKKTE